MIAIIEAYRAGLLHRQHWLGNLFAGIIVGIVAIPLAMAFALASGAKPEQGLYTAVIAGLIVGLLGGSRVQIAGPTGAFVVILAQITTQYGIDGLQIATLLAGLMLIVMGLLRIGNIIKFIQTPVIVGFTAGIGVIIFLNEWKDFFGLTVNTPAHANFAQKLSALLAALPHFNHTTTLLACISLMIVLIAPHFFKRIPSSLIAMIFVTALQTHFDFTDVATIGSMFGGIPNSLPPFQWLPITVGRCTELLIPAFSIALLGAIESLLSATAADGLTGTRHHSNQELIGQGIANIIAPLFGGFAATGAIARTATNVRSGGNSPIAAITHSIFLIIVMVLLAPLATHVPLCTLAAILFVVAYKLSDAPQFIELVKTAPYYDIATLLVTFILTVTTDLVIAVTAGVLLSTASKFVYGRAAT